jgi:hypothetical protein
MKFSFLRNQISRREILGWSASLADPGFLTHFVSAGLLGATGNPQGAPSQADLLAAKRAQFNVAPLKTQGETYRCGLKKNFDFELSLPPSIRLASAKFSKAVPIRSLPVAYEILRKKSRRVASRFAIAKECKLSTFSETRYTP